MKINVFSLAAVASICMIMQAAEQPITKETPEERVAKEQVQAMQETTGIPLAEPAPQIIQKYLSAQNVTVEIINNYLESPLSGTIFPAVEVIFKDIKTDAPIVDQRFEVREQKIVRLPLIPMRVIIFVCQYELGYEVKIEKKSFTLSMKELKIIKSIEITQHRIAIIDVKGKMIRQLKFDK